MASLTFRDFCAGHTLPNPFNYQTMCDIVIMYKSSLDTFTFEGANNNDADQTVRTQESTQYFTLLILSLL